VNLLLDTQIAIWLAASNPNLSRGARDTIERACTVHLSAASIWEMALKSQKLKIADSS
jgi:PIN domain nuclease of toxin-antitoxin system